MLEPSAFNLFNVLGIGILSVVERCLVIGINFILIYAYELCRFDLIICISSLKSLSCKEACLVRDLVDNNLLKHQSFSAELNSPFVFYN